MGERVRKGKKVLQIGEEDVFSKGRCMWQDSGEAATKVEFREAQSKGINEVHLQFQNGGGLDCPIMVLRLDRVAQFVENDKPVDGYKPKGRAEVVLETRQPSLGPLRGSLGSETGLGLLSKRMTEGCLEGQETHLNEGVIGSSEPISRLWELRLQS